jgi:hypothetical protein
VIELVTNSDQAFRFRSLKQAGHLLSDMSASLEQGAPVSCRYSFEDLLALLHRNAPAKVDEVALHRRRVPRPKN